MKILYIDCSMGAAGDMLTAALLELFPNPEAILEQLNSIGIPGVTYLRTPDRKNGILGTHISVRIGETSEEQWLVHPDAHEHETAEHHHHEHRSLPEIHNIISGLAVSETVRRNILAVYQLLAEAEGRVHGCPVSEIHFHEVGTLDALADISAVCMLLEELAPDRIVASPVHVGSGTVRCAHGILPVPAPATALLLKGIPCFQTEISGELCTPTGAALLKYFVNEFGPMPVMAAQAVGYGMGKKDFPRANCLRAMLGETQGSADRIIELSCNLDDMTAEELGFAMDRFLKEGALDVFSVPINMKKNRPGTLLNVLCRPKDRGRMVRSIFLNTSTLGIRETPHGRYVLDRSFSEVQTSCGTVRRKNVSGYGVARSKYEYADLAAIADAEGISLSEARRIAEEADKAGEKN